MGKTIGAKKSYKEWNFISKNFSSPKFVPCLRLFRLEVQRFYSKLHRIYVKGKLNEYFAQIAQAEKD